MEGQQIVVPVSLTASESGRSADAHVHVAMSMALFADLRVHSTRCLLVNEGASKLRVIGEGGAVLKPAVRCLSVAMPYATVARVQPPTPPTPPMPPISSQRRIRRRSWSRSIVSRHSRTDAR